MRQFITPVFGICLLASPVAAEEEDPGFSMMERGAQLFLEGILKEMEPALEDLSELADEMRPALREFAAEMGPKLHDMLDQVEDWTAYEAPEILPNGDIIIRRKPDRPLTRPDPSDPAPQIEL